MANGKHARPTLRDVAREADVSIWTASNTFSNPDRVAEATRERVLTAADALGYAGPNPGARALAMGRSNLVAFATSAEPEHLLSDPAAALLGQGILTVCSRNGLSVVFTGDEDELLVDGRIVYRTGPGASRRPCVVIADAPSEHGPVVSPDLEPGMAMLAEYLRSLSHRHVAVLSVTGDDARIQAFARHFPGAEALQVLRSTAETPWPSHTAGEALARRALRMDPRPTALVAMSDVLAVGALDAANGLGLRVPEDVSIVGVDDVPGSDALGLTSVIVPYRPLGELAARVVIERIGGRDDRSPPPLVTTLAVRRSAGPARV